jgi:hypothetical protein
MAATVAIRGLSPAAHGRKGCKKKHGGAIRVKAKHGRRFARSLALGQAPETASLGCTCCRATQPSCCLENSVLHVNPLRCAANSGALEIRDAVRAEPSPEGACAALGRLSAPTQPLTALTIK